MDKNSVTQIVTKYKPVLNKGHFQSENPTWHGIVVFYWKHQCTEESYGIVVMAVGVQ